MKIIEIPDSADPCDFCGNPATIKAHILFLCDEHVKQLVEEIAAMQRTVCTCERPFLPIGGEGCERCGGWVEPNRR